MSTPTEHKTVQARILAYAEAIRLRAALRDYGGQVGWIPRPRDVPPVSKTTNS
jgi:hypothetical protein